MTSRGPHRATRFALLLCMLLAATASPASGALPLAFQGQLATAADGAPVDDELTMTFRIYDGEAAGATLLWEAADQAVTVDQGLFVAYLDVDSDLELQAGLAAGAPLWLGVRVEDGAELTGRIRLGGALGTVLAQQSQALVGCGAQGDGVQLLGKDCLRFVTEAALATALSAHTGNAAAHHARFTGDEALAAVNGDADHWTAAHHPQDLVHAGDLATIATTGLATDLVGELAEETIPADVVRTGDLAPVATSGKYGDLAELPDLQALAARLDALEQENVALRAAQATTAPMDLWVDPLQGSPLNDGTEAHPLDTVQAAWDRIPHIVRHQVTIHLKDGTYKEGVRLYSRHLGGNSIAIQGRPGQPGDPMPVVFNCGPSIQNRAFDIADVSGSGNLDIKNIEITTCLYDGITSNNSKQIRLENVKINNVGRYPVDIYRTTISLYNSKISGNFMLRDYSIAGIDQTSSITGTLQASNHSYAGCHINASVPSVSISTGALIESCD